MIHFSVYNSRFPMAKLINRYYGNVIMHLLIFNGYALIIFGWQRFRKFYSYE